MHTHLKTFKNSLLLLQYFAYTLHTHGSPGVTVVDMEDLSVEGDIQTEVEVLPVPALTHVILGELLTLDQFTLGDTTAGSEEGGGG